MEITCWQVGRASTRLPDWRMRCAYPPYDWGSVWNSRPDERSASGAVEGSDGALQRGKRALYSMIRSVAGGFMTRQRGNPLLAGWSGFDPAPGLADALRLSTLRLGRRVE